jgi:oligopeptide/dipeptide ABC transporter ATP-binding protein
MDRQCRQRRALLEPGGMSAMTPVLGVDRLSKTYGGGLLSRAAPVHAVSDVSFSIDAGETLALVGESGCGKSSIGRMVLRLTPSTSGRIAFEGNDISGLSESALRHLRPKMQMIFQDPFGSLNPRKSIGAILGQPFRIAGERGKARERVLPLLEMVGLRPAERFIDRLPHEFSGGQRQRIAIARAFAMQPRLVVADEPVSALDVSVRAQILQLMLRLQAQTSAAFLFISHDLGTVRSIAQRVAVMYLGRLMETGPVETIFTRPAHPYTRALLAASPVPDPARQRNGARKVLQGDPPSPRALPSGCRFHTRCPMVQDVCRRTEPVLMEQATPGHQAACHFSGAVTIADVA